MASPGNRHCANCIGALSFPITRQSDYVYISVRNDNTTLSTDARYCGQPQCRTGLCTNFSTVKTAIRKQVKLRILLVAKCPWLVELNETLMFLNWTDKNQELHVVWLGTTRSNDL